MRTEVSNNPITIAKNAVIPILLVLQTIMLPTTAKAADYLQCVPFARELSGVQIYGDAHSWWKQADGRYQRGDVPAVGAVLSLKSHSKMRLGHIAVVSKIIDDRNILLSHANWSPINGRRGQIERNVAAVDVSEANDWSRVKIWYAPIKALGKTAYPVNGFIYPNSKPSKAGRHWVSAKSNQKPRAPGRNLISRNTTAELKVEAHREKIAEAEPTDLIGELMDRISS